MVGEIILLLVKVLQEVVLVERVVMFPHLYLQQVLILVDQEE